MEKRLRDDEHAPAAVSVELGGGKGSVSYIGNHTFFQDMRLEFEANKSVGKYSVTQTAVELEEMAPECENIIEQALIWATGDEM
eukprot:3853406-Karenia_brevis.AAC.1